jgi:hypothetical protein
LLVLCAAACDRTKAMEPGELFSIEPNAVTTFEYEAPDFRVSAHRFAERVPFQLVVESRKDHDVSQCVGDANFQQKLRAFETLNIQRRVPADRRAGLTRSGIYHRMRIASAPPMDAYELVLAPLPDGHLSFENEGSVYELDLSMSVVNELASACDPSHVHTEHAH